MTMLGRALRFVRRAIRHLPPGIGQQVIDRAHREAWGRAHAHRTWRRPRPARVPGYAVFVPVPGDLPVFTELALRVCGRQLAERRVETIVVPDIASASIAGVVRSHAPRWRGGTLTMVGLHGAIANVLPQLANDPSLNHWLQIINAVENSTAQHALLHDADACIFDRSFAETRYARCRDSELAFYGVDPSYDAWYGELGLRITGTWELFMDLRVLDGLPVTHLSACNERLAPDGPTRVFDTLLFAQCSIDPSRVDYDPPADSDFVHFSYVISTYRQFELARSSYEDFKFRLLLIRLLHDALRPGGPRCGVPSAKDLTRGLTNQRARVTYVTPAAALEFAEFRDRLERLLRSDLLDDRERAHARRTVQPFDLHFGWAR